MNAQIEVLVIARPSRFRDSIHLLLASISQIEIIHLADDLEPALRKTGVPAAVIVDAEVGDRCLSAAINKIKTTWPQTGLITLVEDELDFQAAQAAGANVLLRKGFPAANLIEAVELLLAR